MKGLVLSRGELQFGSGCAASTICLSSEVLKHFEAHRQAEGSQTEVGGQLFAEFRGAQVRILRATGPNKTDRRGWAWFNPDRRRQNAEIKCLFEAGLHFVGDWHTHPEPQPNPSSLDLTSMQDCFRKSRHQLKAFVMVIVGQAEFPLGLWVGLHGKSEWEHLSLCSGRSVTGPFGSGRIDAHEEKRR
jgi:integrative and conjugative element protein (TIGR02256 family)